MSYAYDPELLPLVSMLPERDASTSLADRRAQSLTMFDAFNANVDTAGIAITDHEVSALVRVYAPTDEAGSVPALLDIHGGGFISGSIAMEHAFAVNLVRKLGIKVATVEYRLAPEHPFPAGLDDCYAALTWLHANASTLGVDADRIAIGGQSAGGGLTAALALLARDRGSPPVCFQFLGIPELDHRLETASMRAFVDTPMWSRPLAEMSWRDYLGEHGGEVSPYASPAIAPDLTRLPPAYLTAMEFDPLRDEGILYALRMMEAGVSVELHSYPGTFHGSMLATSAAVSRRAHPELLTALARGLRL
jgi:acetyl esterase/lipase